MASALWIDPADGGVWGLGAGELRAPFSQMVLAFENCPIKGNYFDTTVLSL